MCSDDKCKLWAHSGDCEGNKDYMEAMCPEHCLPEPFRFTENCQAWDEEICTDTNCGYWASIGDCVNNFDFMDPMCPKACNELVTKPTDPEDPEEEYPLTPGEPDDGDRHQDSDECLQNKPGFSVENTCENSYVYCADS